MDEIIVESSKRKTLSLIVLSILMLLGSVFNLAVGILEENFIYLIIGIIATLFFGGCFLIIIKRAANQKPVLVVNDKGIYDTSNASSVGFIAWEEIESISIVRSFGQKYIGIALFDVEKLMNRVSPKKQRVIKLNLKLKYPAVSISLNTADINFNKAFSMLQMGLEQHKNN